MLKNRKFTVLLSFLLLSLSFSAFALVTPGKTDFIDYCTGANNSNCVFQIDASGNVTANNVTAQGTTAITGATTLTGTTTQTGKLVYTQQQVTQISSFTTITPTGTYLILSSSGAVINMAGAGSNNLPVIATATATNGQMVVLISTANSAPSGNGSIIVTSGTASGLQLGAATRTLYNGRTLGLIYDSITGMWKELYYGAN